MAWWYKEWGGIKKAETEVVRIKGRRRDKANRQGGRISPRKENIKSLFLK
jgi:hypothetical protein